MVFFVFGMIFQSMIQRREPSSADMVGSHQQALDQAGVSGSKYQHLFMAVKSDSNTSEPLTLNHIKGNLWGIEDPNATLSAPSGDIGVAQFTVNIQEDQVAVLKGQLDSEATIKAIEVAIANAKSVEGVDNQLVVGASVLTPDWNDAMPDFLTTLFSYPGVSQFSVEGNGLKLDGSVSQVVKNKLGKLAENLVSSPAMVRNDLVVPARPVSSVLVAKKTNDGVKVTGVLPSEEFRSSITSLISDAMPDTPIDDQIQVLANAKETWWRKNAEHLIPMFLTAIESDGSIEYWNSHLLVSGTIGSTEVGEKMIEVASGFGMPEGYSVENDLRLTPKEKPEVILFRDKRGRLTLEGQVASVVLKNQIIGGLMRHNPDVTIKDSLSVKPSVKELNVGDPGNLVKELMFNVKGGMLRFTEEGVKVAGETNTIDLKDRLVGYATAVMGKHGKVDSILTSAAKSIASGSSGDETSGKYFNDPEAKNVNFKALAVYFNSGRAKVRESQISNLRLTARILQTKLPNTKVVVGGYADHSGDKEFNQQLSLQRANAVRDILASYGVSKDRMDVQYFGEDVSNYQGSDLWRSRRVELTLFEQ